MSSLSKWCQLSVEQCTIHIASNAFSFQLPIDGTVVLKYLFTKQNLSSIINALCHCTAPSW